MAMLSIVSQNWNVNITMEIENLPDSMTLISTVMFMMIVEDFGFHMSHRLMHWRVIYPYIHKVHHQHITTVGIAAEYTHPIDFALGSLVPSGIAAMLLGNKLHMFTFLMFGVVRIGEGLDGHTGYEFSWSPYRLIPFSTSARYHDFHHSHNVGNYSSFFILWDTLLGSNASFYLFHSKKDKQVKEIKAHNKKD